MSEADTPEPNAAATPPPPPPPEGPLSPPGRPLLYGCLSVLFAVPFAILNILLFLPF